MRATVSVVKYLVKSKNKKLDTVPYKTFSEGLFLLVLKLHHS
jgi:hypothetical protein